MNDCEDDEKNAFEQAGRHKPPTLVQEFVRFIIEEKKWWMIPILLSLAVIGLLVILSTTGAAPFIYTLV